MSARPRAAGLLLGRSEHAHRMTRCQLMAATPHTSRNQLCANVRICARGLLFGPSDCCFSRASRRGPVIAVGDGIGDRRARGHARPRRARRVNIRGRTTSAFATGRSDGCGTTGRTWSGRRPPGHESVCLRADPRRVRRSGCRRRGTYSRPPKMTGVEVGDSIQQASRTPLSASSAVGKACAWERL